MHPECSIRSADYLETTAAISVVQDAQLPDAKARLAVVYPLVARTPAACVLPTALMRWIRCQLFVYAFSSSCSSFSVLVEFSVCSIPKLSRETADLTHDFAGRVPLSILKFTRG